VATADGNRESSLGRGVAKLGRLVRSRGRRRSVRALGPERQCPSSSVDRELGFRPPGELDHPSDLVLAGTALNANCTSYQITHNPTTRPDTLLVPSWL
jgi:hypothetical protein